MRKIDMIIERMSPFDGSVNKIGIPMDEEEFNKAYNKWQTGVTVQKAFPELTADQREFIMTGITPEQWDNFIIGE